jgi:RNA polymerase sigma factor (sigma-70 family)
MISRLPFSIFDIHTRTILNSKPITNPQNIILQDLKERKSSAFKQVYQDYFGMIKYFVLKNSGKEDDVSDVFQDGLVILYEKLNTPGFVLTCSLKTFLYAVCRLVWLKKLREQNRMPSSIKDIEKVEDIAVDDETERLEHSKMVLVEKALTKLGENCRQILEHFYYLKASMKDIALKFGYTNEDNAKNQKYKCLQRLKLMVQAGE